MRKEESGEKKMRFTTKSNENKRMNFNKDKYKPQKPRAPLVGFSKVSRDEGLNDGGAMRVCVRAGSYNHTAVVCDDDCY